MNLSGWDVPETSRRVKHGPPFVSQTRQAAGVGTFTVIVLSYVSTYYRSCLSFLAKLSYLERSVYSLSSRLSPSATFFKSDDVSIKKTEVDGFTTWMCLYLDGINPCSY